MDLLTFIRSYQDGVLMVFFQINITNGIYMSTGVLPII